jgi:hypothetical protein
MPENGCSCTHLWVNMTYLSAKIDGNQYFPIFQLPFFECIMQAIVNGLDVEYVDLKVGVILYHSKM